MDALKSIGLSFAQLFRERLLKNTPHMDSQQQGQHEATLSTTEPQRQTIHKSQQDKGRPGHDQNQTNPSNQVDQQGSPGQACDSSGGPGNKEGLEREKHFGLE